MNQTFGKAWPRPGSHGFTLLEVLVALVIVSLGMIAVFSQLNNMLSVTSRLRDKTLAHWIAVDQITELQANHAYPNVGEKRDEVDMAHATWSYSVKVSQIGDLKMRRVDVKVSFADSPDYVLAEVSGFIAPPAQTLTQNQQQPPGGSPPSPDGLSQPSGGPVNPANSGAGSGGSGFGPGWDPLDPNQYGLGDTG